MFIIGNKKTIAITNKIDFLNFLNTNLSNLYYISDVSVIQLAYVVNFIYNSDRREYLHYDFRRTFYKSFKFFIFH
jgi:hypothetical protein